MLSRSLFFLVLSFIFAAAPLVRADEPSGPRDPAPPPITREEVPDALKPWIGWALDGATTHRCAFDDAGPICDWPGELRLELSQASARFSFTVESLVGGYVALPGSAKRWPTDVRANGRPIPVLSRGGVPSVHLAPGKHTLDGAFVFHEAPESLEIPKAIGMVAVHVDGARVAAPDRREDGTLWFEGRGKRAEVEETLEVEVYRKIEDGVPLRVVTRVVVDVSGLARKVEFGDVLVAGSVPVSLTADLPARIEPDGSLTVQVAAGRHAIEIVSRVDAPAARLARPVSRAPWPDEEIWVFRADDELRQVEVRGADSIDASRTNLPEEFKSLPAYVLGRGGALEIATLRRGIENLPPDALSLKRELRLDLSGDGYSVRDTLRGELRRAQRLDLTYGDLGRASVDGEEQLITRNGDLTGVEVRRAQLELVADSRLEGSRSVLPAVGWSEDVRSLDATLSLPPGYMLLGAAGVDHVSEAWTERWNLGAIFFVLIVTIALFRLVGPREAFVALAALVITWGEPDAPRWIWIVLLFFAALAPRLPEGKLQKVAKFGLVASALILVVLAAPFAAEQIKRAIHPQTAAHEFWSNPVGRYDLAMHAPASDSAVMDFEEESAMEREEGLEDDARGVMSSSYAGSRAAPLKSKKSALLSQDPNATVQTGPGMPSWEFNSHSLRWDGPVAADHVVRLFLVTPPFYRALALLRVLALLALAYAFSRVARGGAPSAPAPRAPAAALALLAASALLSPSTADAQVTPPQAVLDELRARLTRGPECAPDCVETSLLDLSIQDGRLRGVITVNAGAAAAVRLPGPASAFVPQRVTTERASQDGVALGADGFLRVRLEEGVHRVQFEGPLPDPNSLQLELGELPHRATVTAPGYHVQGLRDDGRVEGALRFDREVDAGELGDTSRDQQNLAPWLEVVRTLEIGVQWEVLTEVRRVSPPGTPVSFSLPLIQGESIVTEGVRQRGGRAELALDRDATTLSFRSRLPITEALTLTAPESVPYSQIWRVRCGAVYACETEGLTPVSLRAGDLVSPTFRPFPGETLALAFTRPEAAPGRATTIDSVELSVSPGVRRVASVLSLSVRSSRGDMLTLTLPTEARVESVTARGKEQPIQLDEGRLTLRVEPGETDVQVRFQEPRALGIRHEIPPVDLGMSAVNVTTVIEVPSSRWLLLTGGPSWGPAVLFWAKLFFVLLAAFLISKAPNAPLRFGSFALLGLGLAQTGVVPALVVAAWFFAVEHRARTSDWPEVRFNFRQVVLPMLTLATVIIFWAAIYDGLLGIPDMQVEGNGSHDLFLRFYVDRVDGALPAAWFVSAPLWVYRVAMLAWALWLALSSVRWAKWAFDAYRAGGLWRESPKRPRRKPTKTRAAPEPRAPADEDA